MNRLFISGIILMLICFNGSNGEIKGSWSKEFTGEIGDIAFSTKGGLVAVTVNYKNEAIPENSTCEIVCLKTSNGDILWVKQILGMQSPDFSRTQKFFDNDNYLAVFTDVLNTFEGTDYSEENLYILSADGVFLWNLNKHYQISFSPTYKYVAEFGQVEDEIKNAGPSKFRIIIRRTITGELVDNIPVDGGVCGVEFTTDTTVAFTSLAPLVAVRKSEKGDLLDTVAVIKNGWMDYIGDATFSIIRGENHLIQLRNINSKELTAVALDSSCDKYSFECVSMGDITRIVVICGPGLQIFNEKLNLLQKVNIEEVPVLDSIPKNSIELHIRDIGADYYFSPKGELLGGCRLISSDSGESGINEFAKFVSKYREEWSRYYNSADGKHIIAVLKDGKTIQYIPYVSK